MNRCSKTRDNWGLLDNDTIALIMQRSIGWLFTFLPCVGKDLKNQEASMKVKWLRRILLPLAVALILASSVQASLDRGAIQGTVTDPQGGVVPQAKVLVENLDTNIENNLTTNSRGFYLASELVPGRYLVRITAQGFSVLATSNVIVTAGVTTTVDAVLQVGATSQRIEVTAAPPLVEDTPSNFTTSLQQAYIQDVPLPGRDIQALVQLIPGVTQSAGPSGAIYGFNSEFGGFPDPLHIVGSNISANGGQGGANAWFLDGTPNTSSFAGNVIVNPSPDAVAEFNIVDNGLAAEWGRTSGAVANVVLKSGTNRLHGNIYEINRNSYFSATNPFARRDAQGNPFQPRVNMNNFGGTFGGPVYLPHIYNGKNRTFFFVSYDISFLHDNKPTILTVPLAKEKLGDFTGDPRFAAACGVNAATNCIYDPYSTTGPDANGTFHRTAFATPVIPPGRIDPLAAFYVSSYPKPNFLDPLQQGPSGCGIYCNNYVGPVGSSQTTHNFSVKIDHTISEKHKLFAEWLFNPSYYVNYRYPWNGPTAQTQTGLNGAQPYQTINQIFSLGLTSTLSPTLLNEARAMFNRQAQIAEPNPDSVVDNTDVLNHVQGLNFILFSPFQTVPGISIGGVGGFGPQQWQNGIQGTQAYSFLDNVTKIMGRHTLKGGVSFRRSNYWVNEAWGYNLGFGGGLTNDPVTGQGGTGLAQFLLGAVDEGGGTGTFHGPYQTNDDWSVYIQDDYRVTSNLTLNAGLRYDVFGWYHERHDDLANFDFTAMNPEVPFPGRIDYFGTAAHPDRNVFPAHKDSLGPRVSLAWSPFGNRKTVLRAGAGIISTNANPASAVSFDNVGNSPGFSNYVGYYGDYTYQRPAFQLSSGAPPLVLPPANIAKTSDEQFLGTATGVYARGSKDGYVEQWSFFLQRQLPGNMMASAGYVGAHGLHLLDDESRNYDYVPTATRLQLRRSLSLPVPVDASLGPIYGCPIQNGKAMCPGNVVLRPYPQYQGVGGPAADGFNRYNSFQMKIEKRYSQGLNFIIAYTIQKNIESPNTGSLIFNGTSPTVLGRGVGRIGAIPGAAGGGAADNYASAAAEDPDNRNRYVSLAPDDTPQILNLAVAYDLPFGQGKRFLNRSHATDKVVGGWKLMQNWNIQSGVPMLFTGPCNGISCRPNLIGNPSSGRASKTKAEREAQWYNPAAFEAPFGSDPGVIQAVTTGFYPNGTAFDYNSDLYWTFGNSGTRPPSGRTPGFWNADFTLAKDFHVTESKYFQFKWEIYNALNHQNLGVPNSNWCLPPNPDGSVDAVHVFGCQFGKITNVQTDPRAMEFGMKFYW